MAVVVLMNSSSNLDPGALAGELAAEVLPGTRPEPAWFTGDASPLVGRYRGPSRGRDMVVEVTQTPQGIAFSVNGSPARPLPWIEGWTFRRGEAILTFRRGGDGGPATELRYDAGGGYYILRRR
jgi:hypothetical protein